MDALNVGNIRNTVHRTSPRHDMYLALCEWTQDSRSFRSAVREIIENDNDSHFVLLFSRYFRNIDLESNSQIKDDCQFAVLVAIEARKYRWIGEICNGFFRKSMSFQKIVLDIIFKVRDLDIVHILQTVFRLKSLSHSVNSGSIKLVVEQLLISRQWQRYAPAVDEWLGNGADCCPSYRMSPSCARVEVSGAASWCLVNSFFHLAFVLAFSVQDWTMLEDMLTTKNYCPPYDLKRIVEKVVHLDQFSMAIAVLRHCNFDAFTPDIRCEKSRILADICLECGLDTWAVVFTIPDWDRIYSLIQTGQHPNAVNVALIKGMDHSKWDFFENLVDQCTDPEGVVRHTLLLGGDRKLDFAAKLMDMCSDPETLSKLLKLGVCHGKLEMVQSLVRRVDMNALYRQMSGQSKSSILSYVEGLTMTCPSKVPQVLCILVHAGVSTLDRSYVSSGHDSALTDILHLRSQIRVGFRKAIRLMVQSGAVSYRVLDEMRRNPLMKEVMKKDPDDGWKQCCTYIVEAAATPCSLQHLARLAASDAIGCRPGRSARIDSLPVPLFVKDLLHFKDVIEDCGGE